MLDVPWRSFRAATVYGVLNRPDESVSTGSGLVVVPSHVVASTGRFAARPPGSAHWRICRPLGSLARDGKPTPDTVIDWPFENGPAGMVTAGPVAKA